MLVAPCRAVLYAQNLSALYAQVKPVDFFLYAHYVHEMPPPKEFDSRLILRVDQRLIDALDEIAEAKDTTRSEMIREVLSRFVKRQKAKAS